VAVRHPQNFLAWISARTSTKRKRVCLRKAHTRLRFVLVCSPLNTLLNLVGSAAAPEAT
jgi:hypothetical protein